MFEFLECRPAAIGTYGLLAYSVARRVNEIGIRMALGAERSDIARGILRAALTTTCAGLLIGAPIAYAARRAAASLVPGLPTGDTILLAAVAVTIVVVALAAAYVPARRATHVDPVEALPYESGVPRWPALRIVSERITRARSWHRSRPRIPSSRRIA